MLTKEDIAKYGTVQEQKKLKGVWTEETKKRKIFLIMRKVNILLGALYEMNQQVVDDYDLEMVVSKERYNRFTDYISKATLYVQKAKTVLEYKRRRDNDWSDDSL